MIATAFVYCGFLLMLVGISEAFGWPWALMTGGLLMFVSGVMAEGQGGKR